ncbi:hypothetical protein FLK61_32430 [Paenalkalicoccus suaedae]|uniref:Coupling factor for flagellin transcription and translation n=1 Tax=Paenalkalicoccus suaedae TaxID=2592382 RepID=A0A859FDY8_9BACI|nr:hypothetical protein [Paenalkalicoccus suaedae]QKS71409.1 hypothetical protein FLK61_32430 [Paenalkalicoccus suaedae]
MIYALLVSIMLHLFTFLALIILFKRDKEREPVNNDRTLQEMEDLLISYTTEMKEENERLVKKIGAMRESLAEHKREADSLTRKENGNNTNQAEQKASSEDTVTPRFDEEVYEDYLPPLPPIEKKEEAPISDKSKVLALHKQGLGASDIAKKLQMGAGEVELLLKFYK